MGGPGNDGVQSGRGSDSVLGGQGNDYVTGDNGSDNVVGEEGMDLIDSGRGSDRVVGGDGPDLLIDGPFRETSRDTLSGGDGDDVIDVINKPGVKDVVSCGSGFDRVLVDRQDLVAPDCEKVFVGLDSGEAFNNSIPESFFEGLNPEVFE